MWNYDYTYLSHGLFNKGWTKKDHKYIDKYNTLNQIEHWEYLYCDNEDL